MSKLLDCRYRSGDRSVMQLSADLDQGWRDLGEAWGFDDPATQAARRRLSALLFS